MHEHNMTELLTSRMPRESVDLLRELGELADRRGTSAFVVGGVVRDILLDIPNYDLDIVVDEPGESFAAHAAEELGGSVKTHTRFGTAILVLPGGRKIDIATARSEAYERPGALPVVSPGGIREDLKRRDFTINSMAVRINKSDFGTLLDYYSGVKDLEDGTLRVLTDRSFEDDPTRILRGVRFSARFGFDFDKDTERLLKACVREGGLSTVTGERILNEIILMLKERRPWQPAARLIEWGILPAIERGWTVPDRTGATFGEIERLLSTGLESGVIEKVEPWSVLFLAVVEPVSPERRDAILERLRAGRRLRELVRDLRSFELGPIEVLGSDAQIRRSDIHRTAAPIAPEVLILRMAKRAGSRAAGRIALYFSELRGVRPSVTGEELVALGVPEGPGIGKILAAILDARLDGAVSSDEEEQALAARLAKELDAGNKSC